MKLASTILLLLFSAKSMATLITGVLQGKQEIMIKSKSQGEITQILIKEGNAVKKGEVIAIIDDKQEKIEKELAGKELEWAENEYVKIQKLAKYVSEEEIAKKKENYMRKKFNFQLKEYNYEITRIKSPINGLITKQLIKFGENIGSGADTFEIMQLRELIIELDVNAINAAKLKKNQELQFTSELHGNKTFKAKIYYLGPVVDKSSGTIKVKLKLNNFKDSSGFVLRPGTLVKVQL